MKNKIKSEEFLAIESKIVPILQESEYHLIDIDIKKGKEYFVSLFIFSEDKDKMGIDQITKLNESIYPLIENMSFLRNGFLFEISSPGIFRRVRFFNEFEIFKGRSIKLVMNDDSKVLGTNEGVIDDTLQLVDGKGEKQLVRLEDIKKAMLNG